MKKRKLTLEDKKILKWSIVIIQGILTIVCFVLSILSNLMFLILTNVFMVGTVLTAADVNIFVKVKTEINASDIPTDTPIGKLVQEIDQKLKQGFAFKNITLDCWNNVYRKMCVQIMTSSYLSEKQEEKLLNILHSLKDNMYDIKEKQYHTDMDVNIQIMEKLLKLDD